MEDPDDQGQVPASTNARMAWFWITLILGGVGYLSYRAYPSHHTLPPKPNFIDNVFNNNLVLFAARLVLFSIAIVLAVGCVFVIASIIQRWKAGHWLTRFGIFETQQVEDLSEVVQMWQNIWVEANTENERLKEQLQQAIDLLEQAGLVGEETNPPDGT